MSDIEPERQWAADKNIATVIALDSNFDSISAKLNLKDQYKFSKSEIEEQQNNPQLNAQEKATAKFLTDNFEAVARQYETRRNDNQLNSVDILVLKTNVENDPHGKGKPEDTLLPELAIYSEKIGVQSSHDVNNAQVKAKHISQWILNNFETLDRNQDGVIASNEMSRAVAMKSPVPEAKALYDSFSAVSSLVHQDVHGGLTRLDARALNKAFDASEPFDSFNFDFDAAKHAERKALAKTLAMGLTPGLVPIAFGGMAGILPGAAVAAFSELVIAPEAIRDYNQSIKAYYGDGPERRYEMQRRSLIESRLFK